MTEEKSQIFALRTTANREDQVIDFISSNAIKKKFKILSIVRPHGMTGYVFIEAESLSEAEQAAFNMPYARGIIPKPLEFKEIEHMLDKGDIEVDIRKNDIVELISGPFKRQQAKISRIDKTKHEAVIELLDSAVPIPMTVKLDSVKVIRRENDEIKEED